MVPMFMWNLFRVDVGRRFVGAESAGEGGSGVIPVPEIGRRIRVTEWAETDENSVPVGSTGVITNLFACDDWVQVDVEWDDNPSQLMIVLPHDQWEYVD